MRNDEFNDEIIETTTTRKKRKKNSKSKHDDVGDGDLFCFTSEVVKRKSKMLKKLPIRAVRCNLTKTEFHKQVEFEFEFRVRIYN